MNKPLLIILFITALGISIFLFPNGATAVLFCGVLVALAVFFIKKIEVDQSFLLNLFLAALLVRVLLAAIIYTFDLNQFFNEDAVGYDKYGYEVMLHLTGESAADQSMLFWAGENKMFYVIAVIYMILGRNPLSVQFLNAVVGAAIVPIVYLCARQIFDNTRVARTAAFLVAFFPSLVLWSSVGVKDTILLFFLASTILATYMLQKKFSVLHLSIILVSLVSIFSLRFYTFFMLSSAVVGSFLLGPNLSINKLVQRVCFIIAIGLGLTYFGIIQQAQHKLDEFESLEQVQENRLIMAGEANSKFGEDLDVSTVSGIITTIPIGTMYLLFAPFPWEIDNFRQLITLPEMIIWWSMIPFLIGGLWFTVRHRLRPAIIMLIFTTMLTLTYAVFQGNIGTAYRHRTQLQIFFFIFIGVGWTLLQEHRENKKHVYGLRRRIMPPAQNLNNANTR
jgi:hypothetical protein